MRKTAAGVGLAVAGLLGPGEAAFAQQNSDICAAVYDETQGIDTSTTLEREIGEMADAGYEAHVVVLEDGHVHGIDGLNRAGEDDAGYEDIGRFWAEQTRDCGWSGDQMNVLISLEPRVYDTLYTWTTNRDIAESTLDRAELAFEDNLRDSNTPFQSDVAEFFDTVNPNDDESTNRPVASSPVEEEPSEPLSIPYANIGIGLATVGALGGIGARFYAGRRLKIVKNNTIASLKDSDDKISAATINIGQLLATLPEDDAKEIRDMQSKGFERAGQLNSQQESFLTVYGSQRRKFWPSIFTLEEASAAADKVAQDAINEAEALTESHELLQENLHKIDEKVTAFTSQVQLLRTAATEMTAAGWDMAFYEQEISRFEAQVKVVETLRSDHYVDKPAGIIASEAEPLSALSSDIEELPKRLESARNILTEKAAERTSLERLTAETRTMLQIMQSNYHESCTEDIASIDDVISGTFTILRSQLEELQKGVGEGTDQTARSVAVVENAEKTIDAFNQTRLQIESLAATVESRKEQIEHLKEILPGRIEQVSSSMRSTEDYAFNQHATDVEEDTRSAIQEALSELSAYKLSKDGINSEKPAYLQIDAEVERFETKAASLRQRAVQEKQEMDTLRANVRELDGRIERQLSSLHSLVGNSDVDSSTRSSALSIRGYTADTSASRQGLRGQHEDMERILRDIASAKNEAEADIARERRERQRAEEERQRRIRQAAAARATRSAASRSSSSGIRRSGGSFGGGGGSRRGGGKW